MKKLILFGFIALLTLTHAKMIDGIALTVEGEAVTTAEIRAVQQQLDISKEKAIDLLIQDRLQKAAMKNIIISEEAVDQKIAQIAAQNNVSIPKMQKILKQRGTTWTKYRSSIKESLKKEKFYREKVIATIPTPSEDELKLFYANHKEEFTLPSTISMIEYSSASEAALKNFLQTKKKKGIKSRSVKKSTKDINPALLSTILQTQNGSYTRPFNTGNKYISYKILSKQGKINMPFEASKGAVAAKWKQQQQSKALKDYFQKMRTNADVHYIR
jgi:parvulin-like peptidyl-prolyl isomerase